MRTHRSKTLLVGAAVLASVGGAAALSGSPSGATDPIGAPQTQKPTSSNAAPELDSDASLVLDSQSINAILQAGGAGPSLLGSKLTTSSVEVATTDPTLVEQLLSATGLPFSIRTVQYSRADLSKVQDQVSAEIPELRSQGLQIAEYGPNQDLDAIEISVRNYSKSDADIISNTFGGAPVVIDASTMTSVHRA